MAKQQRLPSIKVNARREKVRKTHLVKFIEVGHAALVYTRVHISTKVVITRLCACSSVPHTVRVTAPVSKRATGIPGYLYTIRVDVLTPEAALHRQRSSFYFCVTGILTN